MVTGPTDEVARLGDTVGDRELGLDTGDVVGRVELITGAADEGARVGDPVGDSVGRLVEPSLCSSYTRT